jgi:hypothetical protein
MATNQLVTKKRRPRLAIRIPSPALPASRLQSKGTINPQTKYAPAVQPLTSTHFQHMPGLLLERASAKCAKQSKQACGHAKNSRSCWQMPYSICPRMPRRRGLSTLIQPASLPALPTATQRMAPPSNQSEPVIITTSPHSRIARGAAAHDVLGMAITHSPDTLLARYYHHYLQPTPPLMMALPADTVPLPPGCPPLGPLLAMPSPR